MRPILPFDGAEIDEPQIHFIHERRRLQRMPVALIAQVVPCHVPQFFVHQRHELIQCLTITLAPGQEQLRDALRLGSIHSSRPVAN